MRDAILPDAQRPIFDRLARLTVEVRKLTQDGDGTGSGVVISPSGVIVTAYHVITRSRVVRVRRLHLDAKRWRIWPYGAYKADVIYRDRKADIAVLKLRKPPTDLEAAVPATVVPEPADALYRIGRDEIPLASGYVMDVGRYERLPEVNVGMHAQPGSSGGPIFNADGKLAAICLRYQSDPKLPPIAHALPAATMIARILRSKEVRDSLDEATLAALLGQ